MRATRWFRATSIVLLVFAMVHTYAFLAFRPATPDGLAVWTAMNGVTFPVGHANFSYGGFYLGFGLFISACYILMAWLAWMLGSMAGRGSEETRSLAFGLAFLQCVGMGLAIMYFGPPPTFMSLLAILFLGLGIRALRAYPAAASAPVSLR